MLTRGNWNEKQLWQNGAGDSEEKQSNRQPEIVVETNGKVCG
jgi:hypothetical protein